MSCNPAVAVLQYDQSVSVGRKPLASLFINLDIPDAICQIEIFKSAPMTIKKSAYVPFCANPYATLLLIKRDGVNLVCIKTADACPDDTVIVAHASSVGAEPHDAPVGIGINGKNNIAV